MATEEKFPLSLVIRAVDKATAPLRAINERIQRFTAPVRKLNNAFQNMSAEMGLPRLMKSVRGVGASIRSVGSEALGLGLKISAMAAGAGYALYSMVRGAVDTGDKLGEMAKRVGLSVDAYAQLQYAAAQADVEQEQFNAAMDQFNKRLGEAKLGGGPLLEFLKKSSPALAKQMRGASGASEGLLLLSDAFEKVTDPGKRAALAAAAFGKSGLQMGQFLGQGTKALEEQRSAYLALAGSQEKFAAGAGDLDNAMRDTETAFLGMRSTVMGELAPALTELAKAITRVIGENRGGLAKWASETNAAIMGWVQGGGVDRLVVGLREIAGTVERVVEKLGGLKGAAIATGLVMSGSLLASIASLAQSLWGLASAVLPVVAKAFMLLWPTIASVGAAIWGALAPIAPFVAAALGLAAAGYAIWKEWDNLKLLFTDFTKPGGLLQTLWEMLKDLPELLIGGGIARNAASWWGNALGITGGAPTGAATGAATAGPQASMAGQAHVMVDFSNMPRGVRVSTDSASTADIDMSRGYSMVPGT